MKLKCLAYSLLRNAEYSYILLIMDNRLYFISYTLEGACRMDFAI